MSELLKDNNGNYINVSGKANVAEGLPLGFIFSSALPQLNANYHLLNGDSLLIANYNDFYSLLTTLVGQSWNLTCTANEYAEDIAKTGNCGKFVINSTSSDVTGTYDTTTITVSANSFKLPTITRFIQGLSSLSNLGESVEAGLPNITGELYARAGNSYWGFITNNSGETQNGAFYTTADGGYTQRVSTGTSGMSGNTKFSAQKSNAIYGNSDTVQPQATEYPYYMVVKNNSVSGIMNYLNQGGVSSIDNVTGAITLGDGLEIANGELSLESKRKVIASITLDTATNSIVINNLNIDSSKRIFYHIICPSLSASENVFLQINDITATYIDNAVFCESDWQTPTVRLENVAYNWQTGLFICYVKNTSEKIIADGTIEISNGTVVHKNSAICIGDTSIASTYRDNAGFLNTGSSITSINKINIFTNNANFVVGTKILIYTEDV